MGRADGAVAVATSRPLGPSDRLQLAPCATRALGDTLLVSAGGATQPVQQLTPSGSTLWRYFEAGLSLRDATDRWAAGLGTPTAEVEQDVQQFATMLVELRLAELDS